MPRTPLATSSEPSDPVTDDPARVAVAEFLQQITDELSNGPLNLPCFPDIVPRVRRALDDPASTADDIVRIAGTEPRLAARLIQTANSAIFNPSGAQLTNLRQAVTRLGHQLVQSVTMAFAVQQIKAESALRPVAEPLTILWQKSLAVASICQLLARRLGVPPDKVFLAGLLHGIGCFYVMVRAATASREIIYDEVVVDFVADWHPSIGRSILETWGFDSVLCDAIGSQKEYDRQSTRGADITDVLIVGVALAEALLERGGDLSQCEHITAFASLRLSREDSVAILWHTENAIGALRDTLGC